MYTKEIISIYPHDYVEFFSKSVPDKPAIIFDNTVYNYHTINKMVNSFSRVLADTGATGIIGLYLERSPAIIITMLAIMKIGGTFLPINKSTPISRIEYLIQNSKMKNLIIDANSSNMGLFEDYDLNLIQYATKNTQEKELGNIPLSEKDLAYIMYTSGSTGDPKGVMIEYASLWNVFSSVIQELNLNMSDIFLALTDHTFDVSLVELIMPLTLGATIVLTEDKTILNGKRILEYLNLYDITMMQATPVTWDILIKSGWENGGKFKIISGGEVLKTKLAKQMHVERGNVWNFYGPTETTLWSSMLHINNIHLSADTVPIGFPIKNTNFYIFDENNQEVSEGELCISGIGLSRGYLYNQELTNQKFEFSDKINKLIYHTGDFVKKDEFGDIKFIARIDNQIKIAGVRIESGEIEKVIDSHPYVDSVIIKTQEDIDYCKQLIAFVKIKEEVLFKGLRADVEKTITNLIKETYENVYKKSCSLNSSVLSWINSITKVHYTESELEKSFEFIFSKVKSLNPKNMLDIGFGSGFLLRKMLPYVENYFAMEITESIVDFAKSLFSEEENKKITFSCREAIQISEIRSYDCIIMNSVVQYFPNSSYLTDVIENLVEATQDGGTIILGDLRSKELLHLFLIMKIEHSPVPDFNKLNLFLKNRDAELLISPCFFISLLGKNPRISYVDVSVKYINLENEFDWFRYDVVIHIGKILDLRPEFALDFHDLSLTQEVNYIESEIIFRIKNIPNKFLQSIREKKHKEDPDFFESCPVNKNELELLENLTKFNDTHDVFFLYNDTDPCKMDILFCPINKQVLIRPHYNMEKINNLCLSDLVREPYNPIIEEIAFSAIQQHAMENLFMHSRPTKYYWVEEWPTTTNGKIDRKCLQVKCDLSKAGLNKKNKIQTFLQYAWLKLTGIELSVHNDIHASGLSSLYIHYLLVMIRREFKIDLSYSELLGMKNIVELSSLIHLLISKSNALCNKEILI